MIVLSGADLVLPDRIVPSGNLVISEGRIAEIRTDSHHGAPSSFAFHGHTIVPGFVDVHVHGVAGTDVMDGDDAVARMAAEMPRFGVTAFCPTSVACAPDDLRTMLAQVRRCRETPAAHSARVLPAHLESNFINAEYAGAQPHSCIRTPPFGRSSVATDGSDSFTGADVLEAIEQCAPDIAIVTVAPEISGGIELVAWLTGLGIRVSLGHSGATCEQALAAIAVGAVHATHLFNRMPPLHHRRPGLAGAALQHHDVIVELICDGTHVHPAILRVAVAAKTPSRVMAITDGTAASALPRGTTARLGGRTIVADDTCARLDDGTMAGSVATMDAAYRLLTTTLGYSPVDAAVMCSTTPARALGLVGHGVIAPGAVADLVVLDRAGAVVQTYVAGRLAYARGADGNRPGKPSV